jgi:methyl-accepting chemotaxis protein
VLLDISNRSREEVHSGIGTMEKATDGLNRINTTIHSSGEIIDALGTRADNIGKIIEVIDDISEQTNLLALNAAIEAARAGEHGRGFAVVADEVRKLAERSQRETKAITELIAQVQGGTADAVRAIEAGSAKVEEGVTQADQAGDALGQILAAVDTTVAQVSEIADAAEQMAGGGRRVVDAMTAISAVVEENTAATEEMSAQAGQVATSVESIAAITEQSAAASEEVSASADTMASQVEEMTAQAEDLAATAEQLRALVDRFTLEPRSPGAERGVAVKRRAA